MQKEKEQIRENDEVDNEIKKDAPNKTKENKMGTMPIGKLLVSMSCLW